MNNVYKIENFLLPEELATIDFILTDENMWASRSEKKYDKDLGRIIYTINLPEETSKNIKRRTESIIGKKIYGTFSISFVDYDSRYGQPNLPPHFDGDSNALIIDCQYKSNTSWSLGVNTTVFDMKDNDAVIFNPNEYPHWRPHKEFKEGEFMTMIFIRFPNPDTNYSDKQYLQSDPVFDEARKVRDSLI